MDVPWTGKPVTVIEKENQSPIAQADVQSPGKLICKGAAELDFGQ
jgi:hypothetical protein